MAYEQSGNVAANVDTVQAAQYNNLRAESKAGAEGFQLINDVDITLAYNGDNTLNTATFVDGQADANLDIDAVSTCGYSGGKLQTVTTVFSKLGKTLTVTFTWTGAKITGIGRALS